MCGIVGLFLKDPALEPGLGRMLAGMLEEMTSRGPDSAGFAVYGAGDDAAVPLTGLKATLRAPSPAEAESVAASLSKGSAT